MAALAPHAHQAPTDVLNVMKQAHHVVAQIKYAAEGEPQATVPQRASAAAPSLVAQSPFQQAPTSFQNQNQCFAGPHSWAPVAGLRVPAKAVAPLQQPPWQPHAARDTPTPKGVWAIAPQASTTEQLGPKATPPQPTATMGFESDIGGDAHAPAVDFQCSQCNQSFTSDKGLAVHARIWHPPPMQQEEPAPADPTSLPSADASAGAALPQDASSSQPSSHIVEVPLPPISEDCKNGADAIAPGASLPSTQEYADAEATASPFHGIAAIAAASVGQAPAQGVSMGELDQLLEQALLPGAKISPQLSAAVDAEGSRSSSGGVSKRGQKFEPGDLSTAHTDKSWRQNDLPPPPEVFSVASSEDDMPLGGAAAVPLPAAT